MPPTAEGPVARETTPRYPPLWRNDPRDRPPFFGIERDQDDDGENTEHAVFNGDASWYGVKSAITAFWMAQYAHKLGCYNIDLAAAMEQNS